jgi:hydroxyacylglutathione hydrolase
MLRELLAPNPSSMTLTGTRTYLVGWSRVAVIDPGPAAAEHIDGIVHEVGSASAEILLTHDHADHAAAAPALARRLHAAVRSRRAGTLREGDRISTDAGDLYALHTPGHTADHVTFHWPDGYALFCGDLMMGGLDTALVAPPDGDLEDYLRSLHRLRTLPARIIHPAHGPSFTEPRVALDAYLQHREQRTAQVLTALRRGPLHADDIVAAVYGAELVPELRGAARGAIDAYLRYLVKRNRVVQGADGRWLSVADSSA